MLFELAKENGYYESMLDTLESELECSDDLTDGKWCYAIGHYSGRDFYTYIPVENLYEEKYMELKDEVLETMDKYGVDNFEDLFESTFQNPEAIEELEKAGYHVSNEDIDDFMESLKEYLQDLVFEKAYEELCNRNQEN